MKRKSCWKGAVLLVLVSQPAFLVGAAVAAEGGEVPSEATGKQQHVYSKDEKREIFGPLADVPPFSLETPVEMLNWAKTTIENYLRPGIRESDRSDQLGNVLLSVVLLRESGLKNGMSKEELFSIFFRLVEDPSSHIRGISLHTMYEIAPKDPRMLPILLKRIISGPDPNDGLPVRVIGDYGADAKSIKPKLRSTLAADPDDSFEEFWALGKIVASEKGITLQQSLKILEDFSHRRPVSWDARAAALVVANRSKPGTAELKECLIRIFGQAGGGHASFAALRGIISHGWITDERVMRAGFAYCVVKEFEHTDRRGELFASTLLGKINANHRAALPFLIENLKSAHAARRRLAIQCLGKMGTGASVAVPLLVAHLRENAAKGSYHGEGMQEGFDATSALEALIAIGPSAYRYSSPIVDLLAPFSQRNANEWKRIYLLDLVLEFFAKAPLPVGVGNREKLLNYATWRLSYRGEPEGWGAAATIAGKFAERGRPAVPNMVGLLKEAQKYGGFTEWDHEGLSDLRYRPHLWKWEPVTEPSPQLKSYANVVLALGRIGPSAGEALPILERLSQAENYAPLSSLRTLAKQSIASIRRGTKGAAPNAGAAPALAGSSRIPSNMALVDIRGGARNLAKRNGRPALLIFADTSCPYVPLYFQRVKDLLKEFRKENLEVIWTFPDRDDDIEDIRLFTDRVNLPGAAAADPGGKVAKYFKAHRVTQAVLLDGDGVLRYNGRIDDNVKIDSVQEKPLEAAIRSLKTPKREVIVGELPMTCELIY